MIKRILYTFLPVCLLSIGFAGCQDDTVDPLPETVPLIVEASAKSFVMGEELTLTLKVNDEKNPDRVTNEDFDVYLTAKNGEKDASKTAFRTFPSMVTFPKGVKSLDIKLPIIESGIKPKQKLYVNVTSFVRGYTVKNPTQSIIISDLHYTIVSIKNNSDRVIDEGDEFAIQAEVPVPVRDDMDINITVPDEQKDFYTTLPPGTLTIKAGEKSGEVKARTKHNTAPTQTETLTLNFTTLSAIHPLDNAALEITMKDLEEAKGSELNDERWVYERPGILFASSGRLAKAKQVYGDDKVLEMAELTVHPNKALADKGWKFYNAWEFHGWDSNWDMSDNRNDYKNRVPSCFAARTVKIVQNHAGVDVKKYSKITDEGYLRMMQMKIETPELNNNNQPTGNMRKYGTAAFHACGVSAAWKSNTMIIHEGCRMEIRARLLGQRNGFNMAIWLMSDDSSSQPTYSEVDILENPVGPASGNRAHQTLHGGPTATDKKSKTANESINMNNWNIYWMEWRSDSEIALGINGEETVCLKKEEWDENYWTFSNAKNTKGLRFILTMGAPSKWALGSEAGVDINGVWTPKEESNWDVGFASYNNYDRDKDNPNIPRMEIDWVRTYINKASIEEYNGSALINNTKFY